MAILLILYIVYYPFSPIKYNHPGSLMANRPGGDSLRKPSTIGEQCVASPSLVWSWHAAKYPPWLMSITKQWAAFEVVVLAASYIGTSDLAANSILNTSIATTYQIPYMLLGQSWCRFAVSVAISTRVGNLLGATLDNAAKTAANVGLIASSTIGLINGYMY